MTQIIVRLTATSFTIPLYSLQGAKDYTVCIHYTLHYNYPALLLTESFSII